MPFVVGETIGPYRITEQLGQGGMATVFKAYHANLDRYVAIKALHPAFMEDPNFLARFQREARVVAKLEHANIVPIYDYSEHEGRPYLVMKFIEGETLKARLQHGPISPDQVIRIADAVAAGLSYAHQQGILHRDVKPSNVILSNDGQVYLADFGLARIASAGESTLSSDMMLGTPQYISPEQALGKRDLDAGTDIYSLGVVLYEMVVGKVPFSGDTPYAVIHDHIYTPLPLPRLHNPDLPEAVERVLLKALAKERPDRYTDVSALMAAFRQALGGMAAFSGETQMGKPVGTGSRPARPADALVETNPRDLDQLDRRVLVESGESQPIAAPPKKPSRKKWAIIIVFLVILCACLCLVALLLRDAQQKKSGSNATPPEAGQATLSVEAGAPPAEKPPLDPTPQELPENLPERPLDIFYETTFDGELPGWELQPGWEMREGALCGSGRGFAYLVDRPFGDFVEIFHFRLGLDSAFRTGVRANEQPSRRYIIGISQPLKGANLSKQLTERVINENLVFGHAEFPADGWNEASLTVRADFLELRINGQWVWEFRDERPLPAGLVGFEIVEGTVCLDDLIIAAPPPLP